MIPAPAVRERNTKNATTLITDNLFPIINLSLNTAGRKKKFNFL